MSVKSFVLAAVLASAISPLLAQASDPVQTRVVDYAGIDLTTNQGVVILYSRLKNAASSVCRNLESRELSRSALHEACVSNALADAVNKVHSVKLSRLYHTRSGADERVLQLATR